MTGSAHPAPRGWRGVPEVPLDGRHWPLETAAQVLDIPLRDLKDLVRITGLQPAGTIAMASFSRQGRNPRAYEAGKLIAICEAVATLRADLT